MSTGTATATTQSETTIACIPDAIPAERRERWLELATRMYAAVQQVQQLPDGYAFRLPSDSEILLMVAEDLTYERLCCPFIRFALEIEPNGGPFWLHFTGGEGVKEFLRMSFESSNLLTEQVAQAAGFTIDGRTDITSVAAAIETVSVVNEQFAQARDNRGATQA